MGNDSSVDIRYLKPGKQWTGATLRSCYGDLVVIVNALRDYAGICDRKAQELPDGCYDSTVLGLYADRLREIADEFGTGIGYDYDKTLKICEKKKARKGNDIGEDALVLAVTRNPEPQKDASQTEGDDGKE